MKTLPTLLKRMAGKARRFGARGARREAMRLEALARERGEFCGVGDERARVFESDYRAAVALLKARMDRVHPAACHRKLSHRGVSSYGYGQDRSTIVDDASTAIAMALRGGASVQRAADAGAASIDL